MTAKKTPTKVKEPEVLARKAVQCDASATDPAVTASC